MTKQDKIIEVLAWIMIIVVIAFTLRLHNKVYGV